MGRGTATLMGEAALQSKGATGTKSSQITRTGLASVLKVPQLAGKQRDTDRIALEMFRS